MAPNSMERSPRELVHRWADNAEVYMDSDVDSERGMALQEWRCADELEDSLDGLVGRLRDYKQQVREDKQQAIEDGDETGAAYAAGKESGLVAAIDALEERESA